MAEGARTKLKFTVSGDGDGVEHFALTGMRPDSVEGKKDAQHMGQTYLVRAVSIKTTAASLITGFRGCVVDGYVDPSDYGDVLADIPETQQVLRIDDGSLGFVAVTPSDTVPIVDTPLGVPRAMVGSGVFFFDVTATGAWTISGYVEVAE